MVTPTRLMASVALQQYTKERLDHQLESWERPAIYHLDAWLSSVWNEARYTSPDVPVLLSLWQEQALWQNIIEQQHAHLFDAAGTARLAMQAARLIADWHIPADGEAWTEHDDARQFQEWYKLFRRRCRDEGWIVRADVLRLLPKWMDSGLCGRKVTVFAGFQSLTPALERVIQAFGLFGAIERIPERRAQKTALGFACDDFAQELERAARWARSVFEDHPDLSIGIFVPELRASDRLVERVFDTVFYPAAARNGTPPDRETSVFHIDGSVPLSEYPLISSALLLLELLRPRIAIADAGAILRSPFIAGAAADCSQRALADVELRKRRDLDVSLRDIEFASRECGSLASVWARVRAVLPKAAQRSELAGWSILFQDLLRAVGWSGEAELNNEEQQLVEAWNEAISKLASLGFVSPPVSCSIAVGHLRRLLSAPGPSRGTWASPIQILDSSDAAGIEFDRACITGIGSETWPRESSRNPLVPLKLQRGCGVHGSSPQEARGHRERMTAAIFGAAPLAVATYSGSLSPLAERFIERNGEVSQWSGRLPWDSFSAAPLDERSDGIAPPYEAEEPARGGTAIVKAQSQCPFRAFAEFRLHAQRPEDACFGFDARDRGGFLHKALQYVWNRLESQDRLCATEATELREIVHNAVLEAVKDDVSSPFHELITVTERERLAELILDWLQIERARKQPFVVETLEQER
ncbi:MAG: PD-(D/E)XK nuclease family protein, partial [Acidobacteriaceae bacterium]|nr:PD-(D/E)XK nuclease family protein [Acidobacteriaceae bacterium]